MKLFMFVMFVFLAVADGTDMTVLNSVLREMLLNKTSDVCPTCAQNKFTMESMLSENEIKRYRIEQIKKSILDTLGLKEPPNTEVRHWPKSLLSSTFMDKFDQTDSSSDSIELEKLVLIPKEISCELDTLSDDLSIKMMYELPDSIDPFEMSSAKVWVDAIEGREAVLTDLTDDEPSKFFMEFLSCDSQSNEPGHTFTGFQSFNGDWIEFDAYPLLKGRLINGQKCFYISLTMKNWSNSYCKKIELPDHKPFLTIHHRNYDAASKLRLKRRSRNCTRSTSECCRENLYVSFKDIKWDNFIIIPKGYEAYYCKGSCSTSGSSTLSASTHNSVIQGLRGIGKNLPTCCGPTEMAPLQLIYAVTNTTLKNVLMEKSVVVSCGCL